MPSQPKIPARLSKIDTLTRGDHPYLSEDDDCYYLWEWNGAPYAESATTNFIGNLQRETRFKGQNPWWYKEQAMIHAAFALRATLPAEWRAGSTFIPVPPSKIKSDPRYDSRLLDILNMVVPALSDLRDLVTQKINLESRQKQIAPLERLRNWEIDPALLVPRPSHIVVFDDILSGGSHFSAMKTGLARHLRGVPVSGVFLARRVLTDPLAA